MSKEKDISEDRKKYLKKQRIEKIIIKTVQCSIIIGLIVLWEVLANKGIIDSFIMSQPSRIVKTFFNLSQNNLIQHVGVTCLETIIGFMLRNNNRHNNCNNIMVVKIFIKSVRTVFSGFKQFAKSSFRSYYNNMGRSRNAGNNSDGTCNFTNSNNSGNIKWFLKHR